MSDYFNESEFQSKVNTSLSTIRTILSNTRNPSRPSEVSHSYSDKYGLATFLVNLCLCSSLNTFEVMGIDNPELIKKLADGVKDGRSVMLALAADEKCVFVKEATRKEESKTQHVTEYTSNMGYSSTETHKTVTTITEYFWTFSVSWNLFLYFGDKPSEKIPLNPQQAARQSSIELITLVKETPYPQVSVRSPADINLTYLFKQMQRQENGEYQFAFAIDRKAESCRTPRRNNDITAALSFFSSLSSFAESCRGYFANHLFPIQKNHGLELSSINISDVFNPIVPLFEDGATIANRMASGANKEEKKDTTSLVPFGGLRNLGEGKSPPLLTPSDVNTFLAEEKRSLLSSVQTMLKTFPLRTSTAAKLISATECCVQLACLHLKSLVSNVNIGIDYIEFMLRTQLVSAIGKVVQPADFQKYMKYHADKIFLPKFRPIPFSFAIRRPDHYPEGTLSIEQSLTDGSEIPSPCFTHCRAIPAQSSHPMSFAISASTRIAFRGNRYLHALISHQFEGVAGANYQLVARTRQFSSFLMMIGTIESATSFAPKSAIILQNKDELTIPLMLEQLPSAKQFRDSIESLSPEQKRFAQAYRQMQLDSSLFAVLIIQLKPQLELLTRLPYDSLTKEIKLTQDLLEMFITYQIPSDLLTFDGENSSSGSSKLSQVKGYIKVMREMIEEAKKKQLDERKQEATYAVVNSIARGAPPMSSSSSSMLMPSPTYSAPRAVPSSPPPGAFASMSMSSLAPSSSPPPPSPSPSPIVTAPVTATEVKSPAAEEKKELGTPEASEVDGNVMDYTSLPRTLDSAFLALDEEGSLRTTTISTGPYWTKKSQKSLLSDPAASGMGTTQQVDERNRAYDLLDALSRSGVLALDHCDLHVVVAATHCFDKSLINTIIQDNVNPIEKVEKSNLILASTVHSTSYSNLLKAAEIPRVSTYSPKLFIEEAKDKTAVVAKK